MNAALAQLLVETIGYLVERFHESTSEEDQEKLKAELAGFRTRLAALDDAIEARIRAKFPPKPADEG